MSHKFCNQKLHFSLWHTAYPLKLTPEYLHSMSMFKSSITTSSYSFLFSCCMSCVAKKLINKTDTSLNYSELPCILHCHLFKGPTLSDSLTTHPTSLCLTGKMSRRGGDHSQLFMFSFQKSLLKENVKSPPWHGWAAISCGHSLHAFPWRKKKIS